MKTAIIDFDSLIYACAFAYDASTARNGIEEPIANLYGGMKALTNSLLREVGATQYEAFITGAGNFRNAIYPEYKGNRAGAIQPSRKEEAREYAVRHMGAMVVTGKESDDACGIAMHAMPINSTVLIRQDKDLAMIRGYHLHWHRARRADGVFFISQEEADRNMYRQLLQGDSTDNIPGIYRMTGMKCTKALLAPLDTMTSPKEMYDYCLEQYGGNRHTVEMLCQLLWIWREEKGAWKCPHTP